LSITRFLFLNTYAKGTGRDLSLLVYRLCLNETLAFCEGALQMVNDLYFCGIYLVEVGEEY
jgi:hypothetical protein